MSQFDVGIRPAPARGMVRCDGEEVIFYSGQMLGDFTVAIAHFETMRKMRTVLHPSPRVEVEIFQVRGSSLEEFFRRRAEAYQP